MAPIIKHIVLLLLLLPICSCSCNDNKPEPWSQFHGGAANEGFLLAHSATAHYQYFATNVGPVLYSSPVIGPDGTVYVGNTTGDLYAVRIPSARNVWHAHIGGSASNVPSPAVAADGTIFVNDIQQIDATTYSSVLFSLSPRNTENWARAFFDNGYTTASPKIWESGQDLFIFVPVHSHKGQVLLVFNSGGDLVHSETLSCPVTVEGGSDSDSWAILLAILTAGTSVIGHGFQFTVPPNPSRVYDLPDPTVAIVDVPHVTNPGRPLVVAAFNGCPLQTFEWNPSAKTLNRLWVLGDSATYYSSPSVSNGDVVIGRDNHVTAYNLKTGSQEWDYDAGGEVVATPASYGGVQVYVVSLTHVDCLENGTRTHRFELPAASRASAAVTANRVYVSSPGGLYTLKTDLTLDAVDGVPYENPMSGGLSSPAVRSDGTVYAVTTNGWLLTYTDKYD